MPRISRNSLNSKFFHNMTQGIGKEYIFNKSESKRIYINLIKKYAKKYDIDLIAYTVMDNHSHLLMHTENISNMSSFMQYSNEKFAIYYNNSQKRVGYVFRNRYQCQPINDLSHLNNCIKYIFNNPVRAKIVSNPIEYQFSNIEEFKNSKTIKNLIEKYNFNLDNDISSKNEFIDTDEDKKRFINYLVNDYKKINKIDEHTSPKKLKELVKIVKKETNATNAMLGEIFNVAKSTISYYLKK